MLPHLQGTIKLKAVSRLFGRTPCLQGRPALAERPVCMHISATLLTLQKPTLRFLPGKSHGQRSLASYSLRGQERVNMTVTTTTRKHTQTHTCECINLGSHKVTSRGSSGFWGASLKEERLHFPSFASPVLMSVLSPTVCSWTSADWTDHQRKVTSRIK